MEVTTELIRSYVNGACAILADCFSGFEQPVINEIKFTHAHSYWANISGNRTLGYVLKISQLFSEIDNEELLHERLMSCMIHEMIHTIDKCWNHGEAFQYIAKRVNRYYPEYTISTSTDADKYGVATQEPPDKYLITCSHCGKTCRYKRKPKLWNYIEQKDSPYECICGHSTFTGKQI